MDGAYAQSIYRAITGENIPDSAMETLTVTPNSETQIFHPSDSAIGFQEVTVLPSTGGGGSTDAVKYYYPALVGKNLTITNPPAYSKCVKYQYDADSDDWQISIVPSVDVPAGTNFSWNNSTSVDPNGTYENYFYMGLKTGEACYYIPICTASDLSTFSFTVNSGGYYLKLGDGVFASDAKDYQAVPLLSLQRSREYSADTVISGFYDWRNSCPFIIQCNLNVE